MNIALTVAVASLLALPAAALAQSDAKALAKQGMTSGLGGKSDTVRVDASAKSPLTMPVVLFVKARATGFGMYEARDSSVFKPGEKLRFYVEPQGYAFKQAGDLVTFGISMDLALTTPTGEVLYRQDGFLNQDFVSHHRNAELMLNGDLDITDAKSGDYVLELTLHDKFAPGTAVATLPFTIR